MKVNILPIVSNLHEQDRINKETATLLSQIESISDYTFELSNIKKLYNSDISLILLILPSRNS